MEDYQDFGEAARKMSARVFVDSQASFFLVRRPATRLAGQAAPPSMNEFKTSSNVTGDDGALVAGGFVIPVAKRANDPFVARISVGRASNCDVLLTFPRISKLHAQFWVEEAKITKLADVESSHGTSINGRLLSAHEAVPIKSGDRLTFGKLEVELLGAQEVYDLFARPSI